MSSLLFLATLIPDTKTIKLATGTSKLSQMASGDDRLARRDVRPPRAKAASSSASAPGRCAAMRRRSQILEQDRRRCFVDCIDVILEIWKRDPPYDIDCPATSSR